MAAARRRGPRNGSPWVRNVEWLLVLAGAAAALALGWRGFQLHFASRGVAVGGLDLLYLTLQLFVLESGATVLSPPWPLEVARFLAPAVAVSAAAKALATIFRDRLQLARLRYRRGHVILCGAGRKGALLAQEFRQRGDAVAVVERDEEADAVESCRALGAVVLIGDATHAETLRRAGIDRASRLIAVCGDDGCNAQVAVLARQARSRPRRSPLDCVVHVFDSDLFRLLRERWFAAQGDGAVRLEFFNVFERGAREALREPDPLAVAKPHLLVVGLGSFGESLVREAARRWWRLHRGARGLLPISVVDRRAEERVRALGELAPPILRSSRLLPVEMEVPCADFRSGELLWGRDGAPPVSSAYVCFDGEARSLSAAMALGEASAGSELPIVVRMEGEAGLASLLRSGSAEPAGASNLRPFGLLGRTCSVDLVLAGTAESVAQAIHESYRRNRLEEGETAADNPSLVEWDELPPEIRESNRRLAVVVRDELEEVGCAIEPDREWEDEEIELEEAELDNLARRLHEWWLAERRRAGYRRGPKRKGRKTSEFLVDWERVPAAERERNRRDVRALPWALGEAGFRVRRVEEAEG